MSETEKTSYLPSEMAAAIRAFFAAWSGPRRSNLDAVHFGGYQTSDLQTLFTNPGTSDPVYYEQIAEAIDTLYNDLTVRVYHPWERHVYEDGSE